MSLPAWPLCLAKSSVGVIALKMFSASASKAIASGIELELNPWLWPPTPRHLIKNSCLLRTENGANIRFFGLCKRLTPCLTIISYRFHLSPQPNLETIQKASIHASFSEMLPIERIFERPSSRWNLSGWWNRERAVE